MPRGLTRPMSIMIIAVVILFGLIFAYKVIIAQLIGHAMKANQNPPVTVSTVAATIQPWPMRYQTTATFSAVLGIDVTTELAGLVTAVHFDDGQRVKKNDLLLEENYSTEEAQLHTAQAQKDLSVIVYNRDKAQYEAQAISKAQLDTDTANVQINQAQIDQQVSIINKKMIRAPFAGRLGISPINPGNYLNPGDKIVSLQSLDPIYVQFYVPQQYLPQLAVNQKINLTTNLFPKRIYFGKINAIEPVVDVNTRNVLVEATMSNPREELLPGIFGLVEITTGKPQKFLTLPQSAVSFNPYGSLVYLVKQKGKDSQGKPILSVVQAFVTTGERRGDQVAVLSGIKEGDVVVSSGQLKLKNGSNIVVNNKVIPSNSPAPDVSPES